MFFDWHQSTMADIINRAKPVTKRKPKFWEDTSKYSSQTSTHCIGTPKTQEKENKNS